jgi:hypothetical protein
MSWLKVNSSHRFHSHSCLALAAILCAGSVCMQAQTSSTSKTTPSESSSSGVGFSIETEMLTYRALESNGEAIACDVAGYLHSATVSFKDAAPGAICNVTGSGSGSTAASSPTFKSGAPIWRPWMNSSVVERLPAPPNRLRTPQTQAGRPAVSLHPLLPPLQP